jgi:hypothetical protein
VDEVGVGELWLKRLVAELSLERGQDDTEGGLAKSTNPLYGVPY